MKPQLNAVNSKKILRDMSNRTTLMWIGVAFLLHAALAVGTSLGYLRQMFHGAAEESPTTQAAAAAPATAPAAAGAASATPPAKKSDGLSDDPALLAERRTSPVIKSITDTAPAGSMPAAPTRHGLDLGDQLEGPK